MVEKVTQYLQDVLVPTLDHFRVPAAYTRQIIDTVELQMISFLQHWDDLAFRRTLLLLGSEEGPFYEPAGKVDVKCFVVVTLRNSPIETIQSDNYASAGMQSSLSSQNVKTITSGAIRFFNPLDFSSMCLQAKKCSGCDYYQEIVERHPVAWAALRALGTTSAKIIDYPKVQYNNPFSIEACNEIQINGEDESQKERLTKKVIFDGYSAMWDPQLLELLQKLSSSSGNIFVVESLKSATRNFEKLMDILEFLLTHDLKFVSTNFYMENGHVERRVKPLRAGHTSKETEKNLSQTAGLGYRHAAALNHL
ncbi:MAG: hypothetical protein PUC60_07510 [Clostridiales bacterium]|nr:hypothetical protein [Clostridiales bacterium]